MSKKKKPADVLITHQITPFPLKRCPYLQMALCCNVFFSIVLKKIAVLALVISHKTPDFNSALFFHDL